MADFGIARRNMVEGQVRPNRVTSAEVLGAMMSVPREIFVPESMLAIAYADEAVLIGDHRFLMEPMIVGRLLQEAAIRHTDTVLIVGAATGYTAALASRLAMRIVAVEEDEGLRRAASFNLSRLAVNNVTLAPGPARIGHAANAPYDVILLDGAVAEVPEQLIGQLGDGGRLLGVVKPGRRMGRAWIFERVGGVSSGRPLFDAGAAWLPGLAPADDFVF